ncbi:hypothetical protein VKS41_007766 [Umbelopsis sp. WA50703]
MESEDRSRMEDVQLASAISNTAMDSNSTTTEHFEADMENPIAIEGNNKKLNGASTVSTEPHRGTTLSSITSQTNELDHSKVENNNNGNDDDEVGGEYNAIDLDKATWNYLRRSRCLAYLTFGEDQAEDNQNNKSDDDEEEEEIEDAETSKIKPPSHLSEYFETIQKRFVADKKIKEYESNTCWIEPPDPVFPLPSSADSSILLKPRLFIWAPNLLHPISLTCPKCKSQLGSQGWNKSPHARGVLDVDRVQCQKSLTIQKPNGPASDTVGNLKSTATGAQKKHRASVAKDLPQGPLKSKIQPILPNFSRSTPQFIPIYIPTSRPQHLIPPPPIPIRIAPPPTKPTTTTMRPILPARRDPAKQFALGASSMMMRMPIPGIKRRITAIGRQRQPRTCRTCKSQVCPGRAQSRRCKFASGNVGALDALPTESTTAPDTTTAPGSAVSESDQIASPDDSDQEQSHPPASDASSKTLPPVSNSPPSPVPEADDIPSRPSESPLRPANAVRPIAPIHTQPLPSSKMPIPRLTYHVPSKRRPLRFTQPTSTSSDLKESASLVSAGSSDRQRSAESS